VGSLGPVLAAVNSAYVLLFVAARLRHGAARTGAYR
jgi:hypothetical protein